MTGAEDGVLVERLKEGDEGAFREMVERYKKLALSLAYNLTGNFEDAEDISQDAFAVVYTKIKGFRGESSFKTWFVRIIVNLSRSHTRRRRLVSFLTFGFGQSPGYDEDPHPKDQTIAAEDKELKRAIKEAVSSLPPRQKEVFVMKHVHGMKIHEIAESLDCSEGTIKAHLFRAIRELQKKLEGFV